MSSILEILFGTLKIYFVNLCLLFSCVFLFHCFAVSTDNTAFTFGTIKYKIKENQPAGLVVGNLLDNLPFKQLFIANRYHFVLQKDSEEYFALKPRSSMLTTNKVIDLETICNDDCPNGSKEFQLIAILMQEKQFMQELRISIIVEDVNDNDPYFKPTIYQKSIKEIIYGPGKSIELPRAFDKDISLINNNISYSLDKSSTTFLLKVTKDRQPNLLILTELDAEAQESYRLILLAWNPNYPGRSSASLIITIVIDDMNDNEPKFSESVYKVPIQENVELHHQIIQLKATDKDRTSELQYIIVPGLNPEIMETFTISNRGIISLIKNLDYETIRHYTIDVRVSDGEFSANGRVEVIVIDVNDCPPQFTLNPENLVIKEDAANSTMLGHMTVIDQDSSYVDTGIECKEKFPNQVMRFQIIENSNDRMKKINIYLNQVVDRDIMNGDRRFSIIICNDMGLNNRLTSTFTLTLTIMDTNDNDPVFSLSDYVIRIKENLRPQYLLLQVSAHDKDAGVNSQIKYFISDQNHQQLFKVNEESGQVIGLQSLDRETQDYYQVTILATDSAVNEQRRTATATIHIHVMDVNDCVPQINESMTMFSVFENQPIGTNIGNLRATDCDIGLNGKFIFTLIPSAYSHYFELLTNGSLFTKVSFDRENLNQVKFCLRITVRDIGEELHLSSKTVVCIKVLDENDNPPRINIIPDLIILSNSSDNNTTDCSITVSKTEPANSPILPFTFSDDDEGPNGQVILSIRIYPISHKSEPLFFLNATEKSVKLKRLWHPSDGDRFLITLVAVDEGVPSKETLKVILVQFADIPPKFTDTSMPPSSISNVKINVLIIIVLVAISTVLTTALIGAIVCMLQPCGNKQTNASNRNGISREGINNNLRVKHFADSYMVTSSIMDSMDNDETEFKATSNLQQNEYCKSEHHWTHEIDGSGRPINYFTLPPQMLSCAATTTHEEQRSDSGRGASDEDNPYYFSTTDVFQYKPLYSMIPNVAFSSIVDAMNSLKPANPISLPTKSIVTSIPIECLSSSIKNDRVTTKSCADNISFLCPSPMPFYSIPLGQNVSLLQPSMPSVPEGDTNIPLLSIDFSSSPTQKQSLSSSYSSNNNNNNNFSVNSSRAESMDDDMVNLSSHIDKLFFTKHPKRLQSFGKN